MSLINLFVAARSAIARWRQRQRAYGDLMALDDRSLSDIGIRRSEIASIVDGLSSTLMVVEAKQAVTWTKPDDLTFDPAAAKSAIRDHGFYAFALDGDKKKVLSAASNVGQCLWSGIIAPERAGRVVKRLMGKDMWSGWGIRTLSADHPAFNPYNYQTGAVWPHDNSLIALGMRRYGFAAEAAAVARDISRAASHFLLNQLPELYGGLQRDATSFPVQYLGANVPQAWAAGSAIYAAAGDAGAAAGRAAREALCRSRAAGLAAGRDTD